MAEGRGPSLVYIHGSADNHRVYDQLLDAMPDRAAYAINLPGRAGTEGPALGTVGEMEAFVRRFIESEVNGDYVLVGHSLGGAVAIEHAVAAPSTQLKGIVLLATGARLRVHPTILQLFEQVAESGEIPELPPGLYERGTEPQLIADASTKRAATPIQTGRLDWRAADRFDRMRDLAMVRVPALIVVGTNDALTPPKYAAYLASHIPDSELRVIEGAGHMLVVERAADVAQMIERQIAF